MSKLRCISVGKFARQVFEEVEKVRPPNVSFSMFLAIAAKHYLDTYNEPVEICGEVPNFYADVGSWESEIKNMQSKDFIKLQQRHQLLGHLLKVQSRKRI
jgi:hypothetical protein